MRVCHPRSPCGLKAPAPPDGIIVSVYAVGCPCAGLRMRRRVHSVDEFPVAARQVQVSLGVTSPAATELGHGKGFAGATIGVTFRLADLLIHRPQRNPLAA